MSRTRIFQKGSVLFALFASIGMVAVTGVTAMNVLKGPVRAMSQITKRTVAENAMIANGKLALVMSAQTPGDCDNDGRIEPVEWSDAGGKPTPANGGLLPSTIGASLQDPWGNGYGYCAWDHGTLNNDAACGANPHRLQGGSSAGTPVVAIISAGPDQVFQTGCLPHGQASYVLKPPNSDDLVLSYSYAEAMSLTGDLWNLKYDDSDTATIAKNLSVTDEVGHEQLSFNADSKELSIGTGGTGHLPNIKTDYIQNLTANAPVEFLSNIKTGDAWISGDGTDKGIKISASGKVSSSGDVEAAGMVQAKAADISTEVANAVAAIVTSSGTAGVGLKASGTSKAIESEGIIDMTNNKIVNLAMPTIDTDAATKRYVDDKFASTGNVQSTKCESFVFTGCTSGTMHSLTKTNLGACKKACEAAGVQCCEAEFSSLPGNPNVALAHCKGYEAPSQTSGGLRNLLTIILGGGRFVSALCYLE